MQGAMRTSVPRLVVALLLSLAGCGGFGDQSLEAVDPEAAPLHPTYDQHVRPILSHYCTTCHGPDAYVWSRSEPFLDNRERAEAQACPIYNVTVVVGSMPPGALDRPSASERLTLERWVVDLFGQIPSCPEDE